MAKQMSASERGSWERDLKTLRAAVSQCEQVLEADDQAAKTVAAESDAAIVKTIVAGGTGDARTATARGVFAIREQGGHRISDAVHAERLK
jgi:hypothetical protein